MVCILFLSYLVHMLLCLCIFLFLADMMFILQFTCCLFFDTVNNFTIYSIFTCDYDSHSVLFTLYYVLTGCSLVLFMALMCIGSLQ